MNLSAIAVILLVAAAVLTARASKREDPAKARVARSASLAFAIAALVIAIIGVLDVVQDHEEGADETIENSPVANA